MQKSTINNIISTLAGTLLTNRGSFEELAKENSKLLDLNDRHYLCDSLHAPPSLPGDIDAKKLRLGEWMPMCQYSIFELFYNLGSDSLELLKDFAFGEYDWIQTTALEVLCRLSIDGKISDTIIDEIDSKLGKMRYETYLYFAQCLILRSKHDKRFEGIIRRIENSGFHEALTEIAEN